MSYLSQNKGYLTSSKLKAFLECQYKYKLLYKDGLAAEDTKALKLGTAFHRLCEVGMVQFFTEYEILEPRKRKGEYPHRIPLANAEGNLVISAWKEICRQPLMEYETKYKNEHQIKTTLYGKRLKGTLDRFSLKRKEIRDYKLVADVSKFATDYMGPAGFDYFFSAAFYFLLVQEKYGASCDVLFDVVDKTKSGASTMFYISADTLRPHVDRVVEGIKLFKKTRTFKPTAERWKCLKCPLYGSCKKSIQKKPEEITNVMF